MWFMDTGCLCGVFAPPPQITTHYKSRHPVVIVQEARGPARGSRHPVVIVQEARGPARGSRHPVVIVQEARGPARGSRQPVVIVQEAPWLQRPCTGSSA